MANELKDVIRLFSSEAGLGAIMKNGMFAATSDTDKIMVKKLSDGTTRLWSDDSKQVLLADTKPITAAKTFVAETTFSDDILLASGKTIGQTNAGGLSFDASNQATFSGDILSVPAIAAITGLTASQVVMTDGAKGLESLAGDLNLPAKLGIKDSAPEGFLTINRGAGLAIDQSFKSSDVSQPFSDFEADTYAAFQASSPAQGGLNITAMLDADVGTVAPLEFIGRGVNTDTLINEYIKIDAQKDNGAGAATSIGAAKKIIHILNNAVSRFYVNGDGGVFIPSIKSGATQGAASSVAGEIWKTASHATLPDNVLLIGV